MSIARCSPLFTAMLLACSPAAPTSSAPAVARTTGDDTRPVEPEPAPIPSPSMPAGVLRLTEDEGAFVLTRDTERVAPPCLIDPGSREVDCVLPRTPMPHFVPVDPRVEPVPATLARTRLTLGAARDVAATTTQVCVATETGPVSCFRPGRAPRPIEELPAMVALAMGQGCGDIVCGVSDDHELVCVATSRAIGSVRIPNVAAVRVDGCRVCVASLDDRVACFGAPTDTGPFQSSPVLVGQVARE